MDSVIIIIRHHYHPSSLSSVIIVIRHHCHPSSLSSVIIVIRHHCHPSSSCFDDPAAWDSFDIMGTHQYDTQVAEPWPDGVPMKEVWQTEVSGVKWWPEQGDITQDSSAQGGYAVSCTTDIANGVATARWIHSGLTVGDASAWLYWWYKAIDTDDNEGLVCKDGRVAKRLWTFGNYSRFIRDGYTRVEMTRPSSATNSGTGAQAARQHEHRTKGAIWPPWPFVQAASLERTSRPVHAHGGTGGTDPRAGCGSKEDSPAPRIAAAQPVSLGLRRDTGWATATATATATMDGFALRPLHA